uniref:Uncharacterized protein n=1 Tax=Cacopsylla melanoneura TaxID=428564 RepID=A0A8D9BD93_9HEMI
MSTMNMILPPPNPTKRQWMTPASSPRLIDQIPTDHPPRSGVDSLLSVAVRKTPDQPVQNLPTELWNLSPHLPTLSHIISILLLLLLPFLPLNNKDLKVRGIWSPFLCRRLYLRHLL